MTRFQILVVALLLVIIGELAVMLTRIPSPRAQTQRLNRPVPVMIVGPGFGECPIPLTCAEVIVDGSLKVEEP
jgi:hypothetical protein